MPTWQQRKRRKAKRDKRAGRATDPVRMVERKGTRETDTLPVDAQDVSSSATGISDEPKGGGSQPPAPAAQPEGSGFPSGLLEDPGHIRSDVRLLRKYMGVGVFTEHQIQGMVTKMALIVANGESRVAIQAFRTLLAQAKLSYDIDKGRGGAGGTVPSGTGPRNDSPHQNVNISINSAGSNFTIGSDLAEIAAGYGISIDPEGFDREQATIEAADIIEGQSRRSQPEDERGT